MVKNLLEGFQTKTYVVAEKDIIHYIYASSSGKLLLVGRVHEWRRLLYAYECENTEQDVAEVVKNIASLVEDKSSQRNCDDHAWVQIRMLQHPTKYGYVQIKKASQVWSQDLYRLIQCSLENIQKRLHILNANNVLKNALRVWSQMQPTGFDSYRDENGYLKTDRYEKGFVDRTLSFLKDWDFLLLDPDAELREFYKKYYDATMDFYCCEQTQDR